MYYRVKFKFHGRIGLVKNQFCICNSNHFGRKRKTRASAASPHADAAS